MPFQSEKQRRYLWANEPEIARDWTDTYGSRIKKDDGGIARLGYIHGGLTHPDGRRGFFEGAQKDARAGKASMSPGTHHSYQPGQGHRENVGAPPGRTTAPTHIPKPPKDKPKIKDVIKSGIDKHNVWSKKVYNKHIQKQQLNSFLKDLGLSLDDLEDMDENEQRLFLSKKIGETPGLKGKQLEQFKKTGFFPEPGQGPGWTSMFYDVPVSQEALQSKYNKIFGNTISADQGLTTDVMNIPSVENWKPSDITNESILSTTKNDPEWLQKMAVYEPTRYAQHKGDVTWNPVQGKFEPKAGGEGPIYYPGYVPGGTPQGGGGGGGGATVPPVDEGSAFQDSLTTGASSPFDYYVGQDPTAKNLAWGEKFGVDPRTMYKTSWADGGRIGRAYGGIMDSSTGRRAYGFGSIFSKIGKAAKKVLKSPIGKAALIGAAGYFGPMAFSQPAGFGSWGNIIPQKGFMANMLRSKGKGWTKDNPVWGGLSPWKVGIAGLSALPFFMGGDDDDKDEGFDYEGAKNKYADEIMRIKAASMAGTLDPTKFRYQGVKDGGRIGMYAGGQSTPSDYTMEDAMMTTTQDKLGGITDVMKQADLNRQGSVGQFYAADGGPADDNNARLEARVKELQDEGLDFNSAMAQAMKELSSGKAQGGRIGYAGGSGGPPITLGQNIQAPGRTPPPPPRPNPMPAPQPNRMGGMPGGMNPMMNRPMMNPMMGGNPMMNRPMMNPMGGRRMAQEGGLMDLGGMEKDYRNDGGFVPLGGEEKADDVPARLSKNEFVFTADAVRGAGDGDIDKGAEIMENIMKNLEQGGQISEETQGLTGAQEMFGVSERLGEVL